MKIHAWWGCLIRRCTETTGGPMSRRYARVGAHMNVSAHCGPRIRSAGDDVSQYRQARGAAGELMSPDWPSPHTNPVVVTPFLSQKSPSFSRMKGHGVGGGVKREGRATASHCATHKRRTRRALTLVRASRRPKGITASYKRRGLPGVERGHHTTRAQRNSISFRFESNQSMLPPYPSTKAAKSFRE